MNDEKIIQSILDAYESAELKILTKLSQLTMLGMDEDEAADTLLGKKLQQLQQLRRYTIIQLRQLKQLDDQAKDALLRQFLTGARAVAEGSIVGTDSSALNNLVADYLKLLSDSRLQILRQTEDAYRRVVFESIQSTTLGVETRLQAARRALDQFAGEGITSFISKDGRVWEIADYTRMATRTTYAKAQREGRLAQMVEDGNDLVIINSVPNPSPLCQPFERAVLSISGKDGRYPSLSSATSNGLFHPNCRHTMTAYIPGLSRRGGNPNDDHYEETQDLRYAERQVRKYKRRLAVADTDERKARANAKIKEWRSKAKDIADSNDLVFKPNRLSNVSAR